MNPNCDNALREIYKFLNACSPPSDSRCSNTSVIEDNKICYIRSLSFPNIILGDLNVGRILPANLDPSSQTYVKTFRDGDLGSIRDFLLSTRLMAVRNILIHCGICDLLGSGVPASTVAQHMIAIIGIIRTLAPLATIYISSQLAWICGPDNTWNRCATNELNRRYALICTQIHGCRIIEHPQLRRRASFKYGRFVAEGSALDHLVSNFRKAFGIFQFYSEVNKCPAPLDERDN
ncbi:hypothetical protein ACOME3_008351 [Neoechinorhynchus agilis]